MEASHFKSARTALFSLMLFLLLAFMPHAFALSNGQAASLVIGDSSFTSFRPGASPTGFVGPYALAFDSSHNLWVADSYGNRVLEFKAPFSTGEAASTVIGQPGFTTLAPATSSTGLNTPNGLAFDSSGNLWVVDGHRVLRYAAPFATHEAASLVIGQNTFTNSSTVTTSTGLNTPNGLAFDPSGNLWLADKLNNRVLEYVTPLSTFEAATLVIGQANFTSSATTPVTQPTSTSLSQPTGLAFDPSGNLWVADWSDGRVLQYGGAVTTPEFPALAVPIVFTLALAAALLLAAPSRRFRSYGIRA